jgi:catechol 2,3-dioxygenase-like lactoylglutathione lyase family enzyme
MIWLRIGSPDANLPRSWLVTAGRPGPALDHSQEAPVPAPQKLAHVVLLTGQKDKLVDWYCRVLSAQIQIATDVATFLTYDEEHHRIAVAEINDAVAPTPNTTGLSHFAFTFTELGDLLQTFDDLRNEGITPFWTVNHGTTSSIYYADPDGNRVELQFDNFDTNEEGNDFLRSDRFHANPLGVRFDPDEYLRRLRSGETAQSLREELARVEGPPVAAPAGV